MYEFSNIRDLSKLGRGATGTAYLIPAGNLDIRFNAPLVLKKYSKKTLDGNEAAIESYLRNLIERKKNAPDNVKKIINKRTVWPQAIVYDESRVCGFVMRRIPDIFYSEYQDVGMSVKTTSTFDFVLNDNITRKRLGLPVVNTRGRAKIVYEMLNVVNILHSYQVVIGDISPNNILIYVDGSDQAQNRVLFIDADSFRIAGNTHPLKQPHTPEWVPPEAKEARWKRIECERNNEDERVISKYRIREFIQNYQTDIYKICLAIMRLYYHGENRTVITYSDEAVERLRNELNKEFTALILKGLSTVPDERPSANELIRSYCKMLLDKKNRL